MYDVASHLLEGWPFEINFDFESHFQILIPKKTSTAKKEGPKTFFLRRHYGNGSLRHYGKESNPWMSDSSLFVSMKKYPKIELLFKVYDTMIYSIKCRWKVE